MRYRRVITGTFVDRPNRFIANVKIAGEDGSERVFRCHVKNTSRKSLSDAIHRILVIISEKSGDNYAVDVDVEKDAAKILGWIEDKDLRDCPKLTEEGEAVIDLFWTE